MEKKNTAPTVKTGYSGQLFEEIVHVNCRPIINCQCYLFPSRRDRVFLGKNDRAV